MARPEVVLDHAATAMRRQNARHLVLRKKEIETFPEFNPNNWRFDANATRSIKFNPNLIFAKSQSCKFAQKSDRHV